MSCEKYGVEFPKTGKNRRSTINFHLRLLAELLGSSNALDDFVLENQSSYRHKYSPFFVKLMEKSLESSQKALEIAEKGIHFVESNLVFIRKNGESVPLKQEFATNNENFFATKTCFGDKAHARSTNHFDGFFVEYNGKKLSRKSLFEQIDNWAHSGVMERDAEKALISLIFSNGKDFSTGEFESLEGHVFVMIGAGSAMGPFNTLIALGATVVAIDIPRPNLWDKLKSKAASSKGTLIYPSHVDRNSGAEIAGCDILRRPAQVLNWLSTLDLKGKKVTVGNYTYLDGSLHVLLSAVADQIVDGFCRRFDGVVNVAFLGTPTDVSVIPEEAFYAARENYSNLRFGRLAEMLIHLFTLKKQLRRNDIVEVGKRHLYNGLIVEQGPNYALAKMIQLWRAVIHSQKSKRGRVSLNVAPATATKSVISNANFRLAFKGRPYFKPLETFDERTSSSLMAGLLLHDILKIGTGQKQTENAILIKSQQSVHGGAWRCAYSVFVAKFIVNTNIVKHPSIISVLSSIIYASLRRNIFLDA
ncbi:hypothetical protein MHBO_000487 [Bonamia ostreae]|uniref:Uncharacterized protein n=1 Tax=Bonamia ostreae TaxID=126728 RepID=A0ABV2AFV2_9EUKA